MYTHECAFEYSPVPDYCLPFLRFARGYICRGPYHLPCGHTATVQNVYRVLRYKYFYDYFARVQQLSRNAHDSGSNPVFYPVNISPEGKLDFQNDVRNAWLTGTDGLRTGPSLACPICNRHLPTENSQYQLWLQAVLTERPTEEEMRGLVSETIHPEHYVPCNVLELFLTAFEPVGL